MSGPLRIAAAIAVCVVAAGCAGTGVTADRLERSVAPAFARQYRWRAQLEGRPAPGWLDTRADCARGGSGDRGAGSDWTCTIQYFESGPSTPVTFSYDVTVHPDGCWTAESGPASLGGLSLRTRSGNTVPSPLYAIDGCFRTN
jgi:hypothetical protein